MTHLLSAMYYIYTSKLSHFFASDIVFCRSQVADMEMSRKNGRYNETYLEKPLTNDETNVRRPHTLFTLS